MRLLAHGLLIPLFLASARVASAQTTTPQGQPPQQQPLPPLPPPPPSPPPETAPPPAPAPAPAPAPPPGAAPAPPVQYTYVPPPPGPSTMSVAEVTHAPKYSLWLGGRLGLLGYGGGMYLTNVSAFDPYNATEETTGNFVSPGLALEADVGARLSYRYIPFVALELGLVGPGHRFDSSTRAGTSFFGIGFRGLAGDVDAVAFASEISIGVRKFELSNDSGSWSATSFEWLRIGLGAEIRLTTHFVLSPMVTLSGGSLTDTSGTIAFAPGQGDGQTAPMFGGGQSIPSASQATYYAVVVGCGAHFDLFGK